MDIITPDYERTILGDWEIKTIKKEAATFSDIFDLRYVPCGTYKVLAKNGAVWMSNTPAELGDMLPFIKVAGGHVLITGLGLGILPYTLANKPAVESITVIEIDPQIADLIAPSIAHSKIKVVVGDAFSYKTDQPFDFIWHDIWPDIGIDNWEDFEKLRKHYRGNGGRVFFWAEDLVAASKARYDGEWPAGWECNACEGGGCYECDGTGYCPTCDGDGGETLQCYECNGDGMDDDGKECQTCEGTGIERCDDCEGLGNCPECNGDGACPHCGLTN